MLTGRKYRLELTAAQAEQCQEFADVCRAVWNTALEQRREYRRRGGRMTYVSQTAELAEAKREFAWLCAAPAQVLQQTLRDLDRACRQHGPFKVRWRSKGHWSPSLRFPDPQRIHVERAGRKWGRAKLPKLGWVRFRWSRPLGGAVRSATVSRRGGRWFVAFLIEDGKIAPEQHSLPTSAVGIDRGVKAAVVTSDGTFHHRAFTSEGEAVRYRRLQQRLARQRKGSANRRKTIAAMGRIAARVADRRTDFYARTANRLTTRNALIVLEDLRVKNLTASAAGTLASPGRNVRQKAGLNRAILETGWHRLELALASVARYTGTRVVKVNPAYTSMSCHACGHTAPENRDSQAVFRCRACGHQDHADINAAKNIKAAGLAVSACGDVGAGRSVKQEPKSRATGRTLCVGESPVHAGEEAKCTG
ncbi:RNA-guided endonuclease InsQ/TnpB family protein [Streptomyces violaceoruber]|uniref:RNA-guided endonuclease InsQ/TnpB family protein n=1 Tax=Streptomyces violaceoruber TaxID=1935 RepID=UPI00403C952E